jgi:hypothetical protein
LREALRVVVSRAGTVITGRTKVLCRSWWPRFAAEIEYGHARSRIGHVHWIDDPGERRAGIIARACEVFILRPPASEN